MGQQDSSDLMGGSGCLLTLSNNTKWESDQHVDSSESADLMSSSGSIQNRHFWAVDSSDLFIFTKSV